jgi:hypothetical protein
VPFLAEGCVIGHPGGNNANSNAANTGSNSACFTKCG